MKHKSSAFVGFSQAVALHCRVQNSAAREWLFDEVARVVFVVTTLARSMHGIHAHKYTGGISARELGHTHIRMHAYEKSTHTHTHTHTHIHTRALNRPQLCTTALVDETVRSLSCGGQLGCAVTEAGEAYMWGIGLPNIPRVPTRLCGRCRPKLSFPTMRFPPATVSMQSLRDVQGSPHMKTRGSRATCGLLMHGPDILSCEMYLQDHLQCDESSA
jgi:hypothetical protein